MGWTGLLYLRNHLVPTGGGFVEAAHLLGGHPHTPAKTKLAHDPGGTTRAAPPLTVFAASSTLRISNWTIYRYLEGEFFAETHVSTKSAPSPQNARLSYAHEDGGRPQSVGGPPQKGTSSSHAYLKIRKVRGRVFLVPCVC